MNPHQVAGTFAGVDASALTICIGFIPDKVRVIDYSITAPSTLEWSIKMLGQTAAAGGIHTLGSNGVTSKLAKASGIVIYRGGGPVSAADANILVPDPFPDKRAANTAAAVISQWTLDTAANSTGHWNAAAHSTVGAGSRIAIRSAAGDVRWYTVVAQTSTGATADQVTLSEPAASGEIVGLRGAYEWVGVGAGRGCPEGFVINDTTLINADVNSRCYFEAEGYL